MLLNNSEIELRQEPALRLHRCSYPAQARTKAMSCVRQARSSNGTFRFGVSVGARSRAEWAEKARKIEDLGYSTLTVPDHLTDLMAPMPALVSAAAATSTSPRRHQRTQQRLRHPVLVAREAATVDLLTDGRLAARLGRGEHPIRIRPSGDAPSTRDARRVERLAEAVTVIKGLLNGRTGHFRRSPLFA